MDSAAESSPIGVSTDDMHLNQSATNNATVTFKALLEAVVPAPLFPGFFFLAASFEAWVPAILNYLEHLEKLSMLALFFRFILGWTAFSLLYRSDFASARRLRLAIQVFAVVVIIGGILFGFSLRGIEWYHAPKVVRVATNRTEERPEDGQ